jgi:hypothetical protein
MAVMAVDRRLEPVFVVSLRHKIRNALAIDILIFLICLIAVFSTRFELLINAAIWGAIISSLIILPLSMVLASSVEMTFYESFLLEVYQDRAPRKIRYSQIQFCAPSYPRDLCGKVISTEYVEGIEIYITGSREKIIVNSNPVDENSGATLYDWLTEKVQLIDSVQLIRG